MNDYPSVSFADSSPDKGSRGKKHRGWCGKSYEEAEKRAADLRWVARAKARVSHPLHGTVIVPCSSPLGAVHCAAEVWGVPWDSVIDACVEACDQSLPAEKRPEKKKPVMKTWMVIHMDHGYLDVEAADAAGAIWAAAKQWGRDPRLKEFHQNCTVRMRR